MLEKINSQASAEKTLKKLILSKRFTSYLSDMDYQLYLYFLNIYSENDVFFKKINEFIALQLKEPKSALMWEVDLLRFIFSPRIPNADTPLLKTLYDEKNQQRKYVFYKQLGIMFDSLMRDKKS